MTTETDLLREIVNRDLNDLRSELVAKIEELHTAINVHTELIAALSVVQPPAVEAAVDDVLPDAEDDAPAEDTGAAAEDAELADELEDAGADGALIEEVTEINDAIASEYEENTRPERMWWLHRPVRVFGRGG